MLCVLEKVERRAKSEDLHSLQLPTRCNAFRFSSFYILYRLWKVQYGLLLTSAMIKPTLQSVLTGACPLKVKPLCPNYCFFTKLYSPNAVLVIMTNRFNFISINVIFNSINAFFNSHYYIVLYFYFHSSRAYSVHCFCVDVGMSTVYEEPCCVSCTYSKLSILAFIKMHCVLKDLKLLCIWGVCCTWKKKPLY